MFDLFHIAIALCPLSAYLLLIGYIRCRKHPLVVSGGREVATFALGISGLIAIGPMELFFPRAAASILGEKVWFLLAILYVLSVVMVILASRPRLTIYGVKLEDFHQELRELMPQIDPKVSWLADNLHAPGIGITAVVESAGPGNVCQIVAISHRQNGAAWLMLERVLVQHFKSKQAVQSRGVAYILYGLTLMGLAATALLYDPQATAQAMREMLRF